MKTGVIIQARMGSTRLPGKVLLDLFGKPILEHVILRLKECTLIDDIIVATTTKVEDDLIELFCLKKHIKYYRGNSNDVLLRYFEAAKKYNLNYIVRVTSDCPLIDPIIIDNMIKELNRKSLVFLSNVGPNINDRTFPRGFDVEIFSFNLLSKANELANKDYQREHVTPYIYENATGDYLYRNTFDKSAIRLTLDTNEDLELIKEIYKNLYLLNSRHDFFSSDIYQFIDNNLQLLQINKHIEQKKIK